MTVFANGLEISAKAQGCKVIAAFPDTCFTPPQTPATPPGVPVPYPDFGVDSDLTSGSKSVQIGGKEISKENSSKYKKCSGDEAGSAPKKGVVTSSNRGPIYAQKWSTDVKVEDKGVARFGDMATGNHACNPGDSPPMAIVGKPGGPGFSDTADCLVGQYDDIKKECNNRGGEAHHIIPDQVLRTGNRDLAEECSKAGNKNDRRDNSFPTLGEGCAICVGGQSSGKAASERTSDTGKKIAAKGVASAAERGGQSLASMRGHGFLHQFEGRFGSDEEPINKAVETANELLDEAAKYESSVVDQACADKAKECIEEQFKEACNKTPEPTGQVNRSPSDQAVENLKGRLGLAE